MHFVMLLVPLDSLPLDGCAGVACCALCCRCPFIRVSFSHLPPEELEEGMRRLGGVLRARQQQKEKTGDVYQREDV